MFNLGIAATSKAMNCLCTFAYTLPLRAEPTGELRITIVLLQQHRRTCALAPPPFPGQGALFCLSYGLKGKIAGLGELSSPTMNGPVRPS